MLYVVISCAHISVSMEMSLDVPYPTPRHASVAYDALSVDKEPKRSGMNKTLCVVDNVLKVHFQCKEARVMRVSVNSFFDLLTLVNQTMQDFD